MSRVRILTSLYPKGPGIRCGSPPLSPQEIHVLPETLARPSAVICHQRLGFPGLGLMPAPGAARCHFPTLRRAASPPRSLQGPRPTCSWTRPTPGQAQGQCSGGPIAVFFSPSLEMFVLGGEGRASPLGTNLLLIMQINARLM